MSRTLLTNEITLCRADGSNVKFCIKAHIGSGASCVVYRAVCEDNTEHLLKEYYPSHLNLERAFNGSLVIPDHKKTDFELGRGRFRSGNERQKEVRLSESFKNSTFNVQGYYTGNGTEYIDMTVMAGRTYDQVADENLHTLLRRMRVLTQVIGNYHKKGLLHLDIKPENIYVRPEGETVEDVILFDFDSVIEECYKMNYAALSYTKTWAAPEQLLAYKRNSICKASDLYAIGEIIFTRIFGRHSTAAEHRSFANYQFDRDAEIFKNVNPRVFPLLKDLLSHTICGVVERRYQTAAELIAQMDKLIPLADPKAPYLVTTLPTPKDFFIGRDAEIEDIHARLQQSPVLFLHGIGGIGKSELAKQYAKKYRSEYDTVVFAPYIADIVSMIADDTYVHINHFERFEDDKIEDYYERKLQKLKVLIADNSNRILLIVDNLDTSEDKNIKLLFELGCRILITSRVDMEAIFKRPQMAIKGMSDLAFAHELFEHYYHFSDDEVDDVNTIINLVQGHTLAIELIAKQVDAEWSTIQEIRKKLENGGLSSIGNEAIDNAKDDVATQDSAYGHIKALFDLSIFEKKEKDNELYVLANLSLIPFAGIQRKLLADWCDLDHHGGKNCINELIKSGWIQRNGENISLHPLIAEVAIAPYYGTNYIVCDRLLCSIAEFLDTYSTQFILFYGGDKDDFSALITGIADRLIQSSVSSLTCAIVLNNIAYLCGSGETGWNKGYWRRELCSKCYKRSLLITRTLLGLDNIYTATALNNNGSFLKKNAEIELAQEYLELALQIRKRILGDNHIDVAETIYNLGSLFKDKKDYRKAMQYYQQTLSIYCHCHGKDSFDVGFQCIYISKLFERMGLYDDAQEYAQKAVRIFEKNKAEALAFEIAMNEISEWMQELKQISTGVGILPIVLQPDPSYEEPMSLGWDYETRYYDCFFEHPIDDFVKDKPDWSDNTDFCDINFDD